jgi:hypothetical protein
MNIAEARTELAAAVSTVVWDDPETLACTDHPIPGNVRPGDAWVTVGRTTYGQFLEGYLVPMSAFVSLGSDETFADRKIDDLTIPLLNSVRDLYAANVSVEAQQLLVSSGETPGTIYALALSVTFELSG